MRLGIGVGVGRQRFAGGFADSYSARVLADGGTIEALTCVANASTLLQQASLLFIPSGYKAGVAYSALPNNGNGDLTWSRNSTANRTLANGVISSVGANVPRLSYMYGSCPSALLEPQRTNLLLRSEEFDNASWLKLNSASVSPNTTTSPSGVIDADTINISSSFASRIQQSPIAITNNTTYTASCFFKNIALIGGDTFVMRVENTNASPNNLIATATIDLANLSATYSLSGTSVTGFSGTASGTIVNCGNGWYRFTLTFSTGTAGGSANSNIQIRNDSAARSFYAWGAKLEVGSYATTYIPTTSATATRLADTFTRNNIYTNGLISVNGGTWYVELKNNVSYTRDAGSEGLFIGDTSTGTANCLQIICPLGGGRLRINKRIATIGASLYNTLTDNVKIAIKWNGITADIFVNGVKVVSATAFTTTNMEFLNGLSADVPKFIQAMALFNTPLSDSNCITITT